LSPDVNACSRSRSINRPRWSRDFSVWSFSRSLLLASGGQSLNVTQHHRLAVDFREIGDCRRHSLPQLQSEQFFVRHVRPVDQLAGHPGAFLGVRGRFQAIAFLFGGTSQPAVAQARHGGVERDPVDP